VASSPESTILAVDLGTSGPKVALVTTDGRVLGCEHRPTALHLPPGGGAEQGPDDWWNAIVQATQALHARRLAPQDSIKAICATAQWAGTVAVDARGQPLRNAIIWMDTRGARYVPDITGGLVRVQGYGVRRLAKWLRRTGGIPSLAGKEPLAHILYLRRQEPDVYARTHMFLEPKDYLNLRMTGRYAASFDSIALHWVTDNRNIDRIDYDPALLAMATLPRARLPDLRHAVDRLGPVTPAAAAALGVDPTTQVITGTPDVQSAAIGSGAVADYEGHLYIGTSSWITCHVPFKKTDIRSNMASLPSALPGKYFVANATETAGGCVQWLRDHVLYARDALHDGEPPEDFYDRLEATAHSAPPGSDNVIFTPWLIGERSPVADATLRAGFFNLSLSTTRAHLCRAVMEGVAYNNRWLLQHVERFIGRKMERLRIIGGGANSALWCQIHADVLDRQIDQVEDPVQCNAHGAALLACVSLGHLQVEDIPERVRIAATFRPRAAHRGLYTALFETYLELYRAHRRIHARLARL
jgi:xylulokinase